MRRLLQYMTAHLRKPLTVTELAQVAMVSRDRLFRIFRREMGLSPCAVLKSLRMETGEARRLKLSATPETIIVSASGVVQKVLPGAYIGRTYEELERLFRIKRPDITKTGLN